jgi:hypothetical protein
MENVKSLLNGRSIDDLSDDEKMALLRVSGIMQDDTAPRAPATPLAPLAPISAPASSAAVASAAPAVSPPAAAGTDSQTAGAEGQSEADSIAYLRARGVEVDLAEERNVPKAPPVPIASAAPFSFVRIPADAHAAVSLERAEVADADVLQRLLAPRFASDGALDDAVVARETAPRLNQMMTSAANAEEILKAPSAKTMATVAADGVCEAYPLAQPNENNRWSTVRLYIDEIGALRQRPRNARAEALASAAGLTGLSIHGDAYVGRCERGESGERNVHFSLDELAHDAPWILDARKMHTQRMQSESHADDEHLPSGDAGMYAWKQTEEDVEVTVRGAPTGKGATRRVKVSYGRGAALQVSFDGEVKVDLDELYDRVAPDDCNWTLEEGDLVITMEKVNRRPWANLTLKK